VDHEEVTPKVIFLPGAIGAAAFWRGVGGRLPEGWEKTYISWPGLGAEPPSESVRGFDDLVRLVEEQLDRPCALVAQSMGGIVAVRVALRNPQVVCRLVLVATSGGVDVVGLGGTDWRKRRTNYRRNYPGAAQWIAEEPPDHTEEIRRLSVPTLLLWADSDPISPVAVGEHIQALIPDARLHVIPDGTHSFAHDRAAEVAPLITAHLTDGVGIDEPHMHTRA